MPIQIHKADQLKPQPDQSKLGFGTIFTDYMFNMDYNPDKGWHHPRIEPFAPLSMDPSTMVLHYGQSVFEGLRLIVPVAVRSSCSVPGTISNG